MAQTLLYGRGGLLGCCGCEDEHITSSVTGLGDVEGECLRSLDVGVVTSWKYCLCHNIVVTIGTFSHAEHSGEHLL